MHKSSMDNMTKFRDKYIKGSKGKLKILDIGSLNINGSYKELFKDHEYIGLDVVKGENVDVVAKDTYDYSNIKPESIDVVISGQALEHVEYDKKVIQEVNKILKNNGLVCIIVPSDGPKHMENDYRRYTVESMKELMKGFNCIECYQDMRRMWRDIVFIGKKVNTKKSEKE